MIEDTFVDTAEASRIGQVAKIIAMIQAWVAVGGSLYFSEVRHFVPCLLCWYQRILMYPLAIILTVGLIRKARDIHWYVLPFSLVGMCVSLYHYLLIKTDWFTLTACTGGVPCNVEYINWLGFINIPFMALTAFLVINLCMFIWMTYAPDEIDDMLDME